MGTPPLTSHNLVFLSVAAVASRPGTVGQKDIAHVGLSCAAKRNTGAEPAIMAGRLGGLLSCAAKQNTIMVGRAGWRILCTAQGNVGVEPGNIQVHVGGRAKQTQIVEPEALLTPPVPLPTSNKVKFLLQ